MRGGMAAAASLQDSKPARMQMQDWCSFPVYFSASDWKAIDDAPSSLAALDTMLAKLVALGLRAPSEPTQAMIAATGILCDRSISKPQQLGEHKLRSFFLNVKSQVRLCMSKAKSCKKDLPGGEFLLSLPPNPNDAPEAVQKVAFDGEAMQPPPHSLMDISNLARQIKMRHVKGVPETSCVNPDSTFWSSFQSLLMVAQHLVKPTHEECNLTMLGGRPQKALETLLQRSENQPKPAPPLALEDRRQPSPACLALPAPPTEPRKVDPETAFAQPVSQPLPSLQPAESQGHLEKPAMNQIAQHAMGPVSEGQVDKPAETLTGAQKNENNRVSLSQSLEKLQIARIKVKEGSKTMEAPRSPLVLRKPAASRITTSQVRRKPAAAETKSKSILKKKPATSSVKVDDKKTMSSNERNRLRDAILASLDLKTKRKYKDGCAKCRKRPLCTLSCWQARGY